MDSPTPASPAPGPAGTDRLREWAPGLLLGAAVAASAFGLRSTGLPGVADLTGAEAAREAVLKAEALECLSGMLEALGGPPRTR